MTVSMVRSSSPPPFVRETRGLTRLLRYTTLPNQLHRRRRTSSGDERCRSMRTRCPTRMNRSTRPGSRRALPQMEQALSGPLAGLVVVDFSQLAQGPFATQILGDLGAEIIKIEAPSGDWMRGFSLQNAYADGMSVSFITYNRNKRSIVLDLK